MKGIAIIQFKNQPVNRSKFAFLQRPRSIIKLICLTTYLVFTINTLIADEQQPVPNKTCISMPGIGVNIFAKDQDVYLATRLSGLQIVDITNPKKLKLRSALRVQAVANDVFVQKDHAYITAGPAGYPQAWLHIVNVSDKTNPRLISSFDVPDYPGNVFTKGNYVFVADRSKGLRIINVKDPKHPVAEGAIEIKGKIVDVIVVYHYAYVIDSKFGLRIIDISKTKKPKEVSSLKILGSRTLIKNGNYVYIAAGKTGLVIADVSNPVAPSIVKTYTTIGPALNISIQGGTAFVAEGQTGFEVINISYPRKPYSIKQVKGEAIVVDVLVHQDKLFYTDVVPPRGYMAKGSSKLCSYDLKNINFK